MGGNGKHRWKISFYRSNSSAKQPPKEFLCPISGSLMSDPVIVASGQTFERRSVQVCREFGYAPELPDWTRPDFSNLISNMAIKTTILNWCDQHRVDRPQPPDLASVEKNVKALLEESRVDVIVDEGIRVSERELTSPILLKTRSRGCGRSGRRGDGGGQIWVDAEGRRRRFGLKEGERRVGERRRHDGFGGGGWRNDEEDEKKCLSCECEKREEEREE